MIDLHSHTNESDGTFSPAELVEEAVRSGVRMLGITDHDTFAGYDQAQAHARAAGVELICGIELSTKFHGQSVHLLGYFLNEAADEFRSWIIEMQVSRRERNVRLVERLRELGVDITLQEVQARSHGMTARPHFAQILVEKGYVKDLHQAFDEYLDESAKGYVSRHEPSFGEGVERVRGAGGIASLAHPIRVRGDLEMLLPEMCASGLNAIEAYHSDHSAENTKSYLDLAEIHDLAVTGGSDFHGGAKPGIALGRGRGNNLQIPEDMVERLRYNSRLPK
jgi:predicted metal-dependent phosphoesterase TrpH